MGGEGSFRFRWCNGRLLQKLEKRHDRVLNSEMLLNSRTPRTAVTRLQFTVLNELLERLGQLSIPVLNLAIEPRVVKRDGSQAGEGLELKST